MHVALRIFSVGTWGAGHRGDTKKIVTSLPSKRAKKGAEQFELHRPCHSRSSLKFSSFSNHSQRISQAFKSDKKSDNFYFNFYRDEGADWRDLQGRKFVSLFFSL